MSKLPYEYVEGGCRDGHRWPHSDWQTGSFMSIGEIQTMQCNNCLALKVRLSWMEGYGDDWVYKETVAVVEVGGAQTLVANKLVKRMKKR